MARSTWDIQKTMARALSRVQIRSILEFCRARKRLTSYLPIAKALGMFSGGSELSSLLGEIQEEDIQAGLPLLSSLVVAKQTGYPGQGYYENAARLGKNVNAGQGPDDALNLDFWRAQLMGLGLDPNETEELYADIYLGDEPEEKS